LYFVVLKHNPL